MLCEMCGAETGRPRTIKVDKSTLRVCDSCARFGTEVAPQASGPSSPVDRAIQRRSRRQQTRDIYDQQSGPLELAEDYHKLIAKARNSLGWSQQELGQKINEKKSVISQLETKQIRPDDKLIRKLEKALGIKLKEVVSEVQVKKEGRGGGGVTLGDLVKSGK